MFSYVQLSATPSTVAHQAPLSMGLSRQEYWSRLPFPSPGDLPDPGIEHEYHVSLLHCKWILYHWASYIWFQICSYFTLGFCTQDQYPLTRVSLSILQSLEAGVRRSMGKDTGLPTCKDRVNIKRIIGQLLKDVIFKMNLVKQVVSTINAHFDSENTNNKIKITTFLPSTIN